MSEDGIVEWKLIFHDSLTVVLENGGINLHESSDDISVDGTHWSHGSVLVGHWSGGLDHGNELVRESLVDGHLKVSSIGVSDEGILWHGWLTLLVELLHISELLHLFLGDGEDVLLLDLAELAEVLVWTSTTWSSLVHALVGLDGLLDELLSLGSGKRVNVELELDEVGEGLLWVSTEILVPDDVSWHVNVEPELLEFLPGVDGSLGEFFPSASVLLKVLFVNGLLVVGTD